MSLIPLHLAHAFTYCLPRSSGWKSVTSLWSAVRRSSPVYCSFCSYILECRYSTALLSCTDFTTSITCIPVLHIKCSGLSPETSLCPLFKYSSPVYCSVFHIPECDYFRYMYTCRECPYLVYMHQWHSSTISESRRFDNAVWRRSVRHSYFTMLTFLFPHFLMWLQCRNSIISGIVLLSSQVFWYCIPTSSGSQCYDSP